MRKRFKTFSVFLILSVLLSVSSFAADFPEPTDNFFVNDFANVIDSNDEKDLMALGASLYKQTTAQVVVVTVDSLNGADVDEYTLELGREWGVGNEDKNNGVVILLSVSDREVSIQTGYGLEGCLPDGKVGRILDNYAIPYFSDDDFSTGLAETYKAVTTVVYEEYGVTPEIDYDYENYNTDTEENNGFTVVLFTVIIILIILSIFKKGRGRIFIGPVFHGGFGGYGGSRGGGHSGGGGSFGGFSGGGGSFGGGGASRKF